MHVNKTIMNDLTILELRASLRDKLPGILIINLFLLPFVLMFMFSSIQAPQAIITHTFTIFFVILYLGISVFHLAYRRQVTCTIDPIKRTLTIKRLWTKNEATIGMNAKVVFKRRYHLWFRFGGDIPLVNLEKKLQEEFGHLYPIQFVLQPPLRWTKGKGRYFGRKKRPIDIIMPQWLDVTNKVEIIEKYRFGTRTKVLGIYDTAIFTPVITDILKGLELTVSIQQESEGQSLEIISLSIEKTTAMYALAEEIADTLIIPLLDDSGLTPLLRKPGTTDEFVGLTIKQQLGNQHLPKEKFSIDPELISASFDDSKVKLLKITLDRDEKMATKLLKAIFYTVLLLISLVLLEISVNYALKSFATAKNLFSSSDSNVTSWTLLLNLVLLGMFLLATFFSGKFSLIRLNFLRKQLILNFNPNYVTVQIRGIFHIKTLGIFPIESIERVMVIQRWVWSQLEIVADDKRIIIPGQYNHADAIKMKKAIELSLVTHAN